MARGEPLLTPEETAEYLAVPLATLYQWRYRRVGPPALKVGRHLRYRARDLETWLDEQADPRALEGDHLQAVRALRAQLAEVTAELNVARRGEDGPEAHYEWETGR